MSWPLNPGLRFNVELFHGGGDRVTAKLMDGQELEGVVHGWDMTEPDGVLKLWVAACALSLPVAALRQVERDCIVEYPLAGEVPATAPPRSLITFRLRYVDGKVLVGKTRGFVNCKGSGLYLFVLQAGDHYRGLWVPRHALSGVRMEAVQPAPVAGRSLVTDMPGLFARLEEAHARPVVSFGQALFDLKLIDEETLLQWRALDGEHLRPRLDQMLAAGQLSRAQVEAARARVAATPEVDALQFLLEPRAIERIPWPVAARYHAVPLGMVSDTLFMATADPMDRDLQMRLAMIADCPVALVWADPDQIDARLALESHTPRGPAPIADPDPDPDPVRAPAEDRGGTAAGEADLVELMAQAQKEISGSSGKLQQDVKDESSSVVQLVKRIILDAHRQKASDIHIETNTREQPSRVRFRKDGDMEDYVELPPDLRAAIVSRLKVMSKLDISERRRPQDGKINFADFSDVHLELRVAILPTHDNMEDVVMRLLASSEPIPLSRLGFSPRDDVLVKGMARRPYGLILACGPTGSGKTTSLHSLLAEINTPSRKIWTAEDPIEITQPGLRQLQVNPKIGVTFASAMRAFLRADPDVIMIGEIRDQETASISIEASLTGHLVLSTLHTNSAAESIVRLLDLGMDPMNFADSLIGIVAQRLVRALCGKCKVPEVLTPAELEALVVNYVDGTGLAAPAARARLFEAADRSPAEGLRRFRAVGCPACGGKGYKGRMGIYEVLENGEEIKLLIETRAHTKAVFDQAIACGMRSLRQDALEKMVAGAIDMEQARSLFGQPSSPEIGGSPK